MCRNPDDNDNIDEENNTFGESVSSQDSLISEELESLCDDNNEKKSLTSVSYLTLFTKNPNFRWFMVSYIATHCGSWLTYIASISLLKELGYNEQIYTSLLVVVHLVPNTLFAFPGGIIADSRDRKKNMFQLDCIGAIIALCYLFVFAKQSILLLYICTFIQESIQGLYEPNRSAILPQVLHSKIYLEKANEVSTICWSLTTAIAASLGGFIVDKYGVTVCYLVDSILFVVSAVILALCMTGDYNVDYNKKKNNNKTLINDDDDDCDLEDADIDDSNSRENVQEESATTSCCTMIQELWKYLRSCDVGAYVFIKACGALMFGASDVINVTFASEKNDVEGGEELDSERLGWMFAAVGIGCFIGPLLMPEGRSYMIAIIFGFIQLGLGYGLIGWSNQYWQKCMWTIPRSAGTAILWVDSSILIQKATPTNILGRVSGIDFGLALLGEATSAFVAGLLQDNGYTADTVAFILSGTSFSFAIFWSCWHFLHKTKNSIEYNQLSTIELTDSSNK